MNTENHSNVSECKSLYSEILTRSLCAIFVLDVNDCMPNPCENGGNCTDGVNEYLCTSIPGYTGTDCGTGKLLRTILQNIYVLSYVYEFIFQILNTEIHYRYHNVTVSSVQFVWKVVVLFVVDVDDCMPNPCENGGNCTDGINGYNCTCAPGYTGVNCETSKLT